MFAGSIQDRLRGRDRSQPGVRGSFQARGGYIQGSEATCKHIPELREKDRRIASLETQLDAAQEAREQATAELEQLREKLEDAAIIRQRNEAIIASQKLALQQLEVALKNQQTAVERILGDDADLSRVQEEVEGNTRLLQRALPKAAGAPRPPPAATSAQLSALSAFGFGGGGASATAAAASDSDGDSSVQAAPTVRGPAAPTVQRPASPTIRGPSGPTARLNTPGTSPATSLSPRPKAGAFL